MSGISTVWDDTAGFVKKYRYALDIYLMTVLSSSYEIIMYLSLNAPGHVINVVGELNATDKRYLKEKWNLLINWPVTKHQRL